MIGGSQELNKYVLKTPEKGLSHKGLNIMCFIGLFIFPPLLSGAFEYLGKRMKGNFFLVAVVVVPIIALFVITIITPMGEISIGLIWFIIYAFIYIIGWINANVVLSRYQSSARERIAQIDKLSGGPLAIDAVLEKGLLQSKVLSDRETAAVTLVHALQMPGGDALLLHMAGFGLFLNKRYAEAKQFFDRALSSTNDVVLIKRVTRMQAKVEKKLR